MMRLMLGDEVKIFSHRKFLFEFYTNKKPFVRNLFKIFTLRAEIRNDIYLPFFYNKDVRKEVSCMSNKSFVNSLGYSDEVNKQKSRRLLWLSILKTDTY